MLGPHVGHKTTFSWDYWSTWSPLRQSLNVRGQGWATVSTWEGDGAGQPKQSFQKLVGAGTMRNRAIIGCILSGNTFSGWAFVWSSLSKMVETILCQEETWTSSSCRATSSTCGSYSVNSITTLNTRGRVTARNPFTTSSRSELLGTPQPVPAPELQFGPAMPRAALPSLTISFVSLFQLFCLWLIWNKI